jgi:hypothetical protein
MSKKSYGARGNVSDAHDKHHAKSYNLFTEDIFCGMYDSETSALKAFDDYNQEQNAEFTKKIDPIWKDE